MSSSNTSPDTYSNPTFDSVNAPTAGQASHKRRRSTDDPTSPKGDNTGSGTPSLKRIACVICRKRKLKCDGSKPSCSTCKRLHHDCAYDEVRRKSGPKRGYVKALEERLKQVEELLKTRDPSAAKSPDLARPNFTAANTHTSTRAMLATANADFGVNNPDIAVVNDRDHERWYQPGDSPQPGMEELAFDPNLNMGGMTMDPTFTWEMIGLGLDEPLPPQDTIDELHQIYFEKIHPSVPMIHKYRYLAAMNLAPNQRPPVCLRYAMWTLACSVTDKYLDLKDHFYQRSRKYVEQDYLKGHGEHLISVGHAQTHILLSTYEFKMMYFPRAWMSTGSGIRLCQMMGLHRLDGAGLDVKQCLPPARDWTEREERRRTFWMAFAEDRYASIGTGWPMSIDERDVLTNLPASEEAFEKSKPEQTTTLSDAFNPKGAEKLSAFGSIALMAALFGRNLVHLHRPDANELDSDLNGEFWKRHRQLDNILLNTSLSLPSHLKVSNGNNSPNIHNPNIVYANMNIHTSTICLHQAAVYKADKNHLPASVSKESKMRCINAANEIAAIMRMISHLDLSAMNPFISFCLYVAARVFVQYLKSRPEDNTTGDALRFLLAAMNAMKGKNPLTESFLVQLDVDLESLGLRDPKYKALINGHLNNPQAQIFRDHHGNGTDPCNFMKIVDNDPTVQPSSPTTTSAPAPATSTPPVTSDRAPPPFSGYADSAMPWIPAERGFPSRPGAGTNLGSMPGIVVLPNANDTTYGVQRHFTSDMDMELSSGDAAVSDRPTPSSTAPSDGHRPGNLAPGKGSGHSSFETSPVASHNVGIPEQHHIYQQHQQGGEGGYMPALQNPGAMAGFGMGGSPGRGAEFASAQWEMASALTPIGEGMLRELMSIGPMDIGTWEGQAP
ncbi:hypothetical protein V498_05695 [Pseudogymnoascus sp. VKM F-4517 (FW-2822)]|nr:hypothetical protein V498_05695 [Pseudogymnoascus sp. VKM F-4517 (FW-2822)]